MKNRLLSLLLPIVPKNDLSHLVGRLVHHELPPLLAQKSVEIFARYYKINLNEAELPVEQYRTIGELFTRKLKAGLRPIGLGPVHPADSLITEAGRIERDHLIQAKGKKYSVAEFLRNPTLAVEFEGGSFLTYYLCPTDYHRVHSPVDGEITLSCHVPGALWPVNEWSVNSIQKLFNVNERVVTLIATPHGMVAVIMVAATNVGNMSMSYDAGIATNTREKGRAVKEKMYQAPISIRRGEELGVFHMGSTVVVLYPKGYISLEAASLKGQQVKVGESVVSH